MKCHECLLDLSESDLLLPIYRFQTSGYGDTQTVGVVLDGYAHAWHFKQPEEKYHY